jgi:hypothetical protein
MKFPDLLPIQPSAQMSSMAGSNLEESMSLKVIVRTAS